MPRTIGQLKNDKRTTEQKQADFLEYFMELANVSKAAKKAKVGRSTVYDWLRDDANFQILYEQAEPVALGVLEDEATRRAVSGTDKPVFYKGQKVGTVKEYSDTLMIVLLKARAPEKYAERQMVKTKNTNFNHNTKDMTPEEMRQIAKELEDEY